MKEIKLSQQGKHKGKFVAMVNNNMETYYKKTFIEGKEENLPKKDDLYFVQKHHIETKQDDDGDAYSSEYDELTTSYYNESYNNYWINNVDWYLHPVQSNESAIIAKYEEYFKYINKFFAYNKSIRMKRFESELSQLKSGNK